MKLPIEDIWANKNVAKVTLRDARDKPGVAAELFESLYRLNVSAILIVQGNSRKGRADLAFLVMESDLPTIQEHQEELMESVGAKDIVIDRKVAVISFLGSKELSRTPGIAYRIFNILAHAGVNIELISATTDSLTVVIREDRFETAIEAIRENLEIEPRENYFMGE